MRKLFLILLLISTTVPLLAQIHEIGGVICGSNLIGDMGSTTFIKPNAPAGGLFYKYNKNPRIAYRFSYSNLVIEPGESENEIRATFDLPLKKNIEEFSAGIDFNFLEYSLSSRDYRSTPYFIFELAAIQYKAATSLKPTLTPEVNYESRRSLAIPFGLGIKSRITNHLSIGLEAKIRYTFTDDLDDSKFIKEVLLPFTGNPEIAKFNNPSTNDWFTSVGFTIAYTFGRAPCY